MMRSFGPLLAVADAAPDWDPAGAPRSPRYGDGYHGSDDAVAESHHVFVVGSGLDARLAGLGSGRLTVGELGFGSGLNFLLTWQAWRAAGTGRLHYLGIDRHPLRAPDMARALQRVPALAPLATALCAALPAPLAGLHRISLDDGRVLLDLYWADAADALAEIDSLGVPLVDIWYLDGFAPSRNPEMWTAPLFRSMARSSRDGAAIATYSAAGQVRRDLEDAGFTVRRRPGFGSKRECLHGELRHRPAPAPPLTPWDQPDAIEHYPGGDADGGRRALVIGAGLAGAHVAAALARRDWQVTVLDAGGVASRASGNEQGLLFTRLSHRRSTLGDFSLAAFHFAAQLYRAMLAAGTLRAGHDGDLSGCFQASRGDDNALRAVLAALPELAEALDAGRAAERLGLPLASAGFWQPGSGWLSPPAVCRALLQHPSITLHCDSGPLQLLREAGTWVAVDAAGAAVAKAPVAVLAAGTGCLDLVAGIDLPLRAVRGQTTRLPSPPGPPLRHAYCHRGYIAPAVDGVHCLGATFRPGDTNRELRASEHEENLAVLGDALPAWREHLASLDPASLSGRAEIRCVSPDYLPIAGPVPDTGALQARFAPLAHDARHIIPARAPCRPGLWISTAHGSRGLSYAALAGEIVASAVCGEAPPLPRELARAVSPARFAIRAIVRGKDPRGAS